MIRRLTPPGMPPPAARYSHISEVPAGQRLYFFSGQVGVGADGVIPDEAGDQAEVIFRSIGAGLAAVGLTFDAVVRLNTFVSDAAYLAPYMAVRDRFVGTPPPSSTLLIVSGFADPAFKVEVEIVAAGPADPG